MKKGKIASLALTAALALGAAGVQTIAVPQQASASFKPILYKQTDSRWANDKMGGGATIAEDGCVISDIAMALHHQAIHVSGSPADPGNLNSWLKSHGGYSGNSVIWSAVDKLSSTHISFVGRYYNHSDLSASKLESYLNNGNYAVLANVRSGSHWVLLTNYENSSTFYVNDPGYSNTTYSYSSMVGYAVYHITHS